MGSITSCQASRLATRGADITKSHFFFHKHLPQTASLLQAFDQQILIFISKPAHILDEYGHFQVVAEEGRRLAATEPSGSAGRFREIP